MKYSPYQMGSCGEHFNNRYIVQLVKNYRSHKCILAPSNELFYRSQLVPHAHTGKIKHHSIVFIVFIYIPPFHPLTATIDWYLSTAILPSPQYPIVFQSVQGKCNRGNANSFHNNEELNEVIWLVSTLLKGHPGTVQRNQKPMRKITIDDIGIISPYKKQCRNIVNACRQNGWSDMKVGSVEVFQGQEKPVIIVSTVRSQMNTIGFLDNWRVRSQQAITTLMLT